MRLLSALLAVFAASRLAQSLSSSLTAVDAFVSTSSDVSMWVYIPETQATDTQAIVVAIHSCERSADYYFENTGYAALADQDGFIVIYPNNSSPSGCWDTTSSASTSVNGGGDSNAIANMVSYAVKNLNGNDKRVAVTGSSSGGVMVNLLAGVYPNVFQAGSVYSGEYSHESVPDYTGSRPKMMIYHGTVDETYPYSNLAEELDGWASVLDVTFSHNVTDTPAPGYTQMVYGDGLKLVGVSAAGVGHTVPVDAAVDLAWLCIYPACGEDGLPIVSTSSSSSSTSSTSSEISTSSTISSSTPTSTDSSPTKGGARTTSVPTVTSTASNTLASRTSTSTPPVATETTAAASGISSGAKAGIGIAAIGSLAFLAAGAFMLWRRRQQKRRSRPELEHKMTSLETEGQEYHSGYGVVPVHDAGLARDNAEEFPEEFPARTDSKTTATTGFLAHARPQHARNRSTSTLLPPPSLADDQRYSVTSVSSTTNLLGHSSGEESRPVSMATVLHSRQTSRDEEQDISDISFKA